MNVLMTKRKVGLLLLGIVQLIVLSMIAAMQLNLSYFCLSNCPVCCKHYFAQDCMQFAGSLYS